MPLTLTEIKTKAKERLTGYCRVCRFCNGEACRGQVPGVGGVGTGTGFVNNVKALADISLNMRTIHKAANPEVSTDIFGEKLKSPIIIAPMAGMSYNLGGGIPEDELVRALVQGGKDAGSMVMTGDGQDPVEFETAIKVITENKWGVPVLKPWSQRALIARIRVCEEAKVPALGIDLDGIGLSPPGVTKEEYLSPKSFKQLVEIVNSTPLPVFFKGIMSEYEAELAVKSGAVAVVVSNHGGRVLDYTPGAASVLPSVVKKVSGRVKVLVDGGVRSGVDILKYLALGADAVLVGRPFLVAAAGGGREGVKILMDTLTEDLRLAMVLTGCQKICDISAKILRRENI